MLHLTALVSIVTAWGTTATHRLCDLNLSTADQKHFAVTGAELARATSPRDHARDLWRLAQPRFGRPSYRGRDFDVTVVGRLNAREGRPAVVVDRVRALLGEYYARLAAIGLRPKHRNHVLVAMNQDEFKPNCLGGPIGDGAFTIPSGAAPLIRRLGKSWGDLPGYGTDQFIVLPYGDDGGPLINRFALAHELAHDVVRTNHRALDEAMADALAMYLTGLAITVDVHARLGFLNGVGTIVVYEPRVRLVRDLRTPVVQRATELLPDLGKVHANGSLFAAVFAAVHARHGPMTMISLIKFLSRLESRLPVVANRTLERQRLPRASINAEVETNAGEASKTSHAMPSLSWSQRWQWRRSRSIHNQIVALLRADQQAQAPDTYTFVDPDRPEEVGPALVANARHLGTLMAEWASGAHVNIDDILILRGLK